MWWKMRSTSNHPTYDYDEIAEKIFYPAYDEIIDNVITTLGITEGKFLDVGCGGGHLGFAMMKRSSMHGSFIDIHEGAAEVTEIRAKKLGFDGRSVIKCGNVEEMPFEDNEFDLIISRGSVQFWENQEKAFREILRVMKTGGKAYIGGGLGSLKTQQEIQKKLEAIGKTRYGFKKEHDKYTFALSIDEYKQLFEILPCKYKLISNEQSKRLIILEKI